MRADSLDSCPQGVVFGDGRYCLMSLDTCPVYSHKGVVYLFESQRYIITCNNCSSKFVVKVRDHNSEISKNIAGKFMAEIRIDNYIGKSKLCVITIDNYTRPSCINIEILSNKLIVLYDTRRNTESLCESESWLHKIIELHKKFVNILIRELLNFSYTIPFNIYSLASFPVKETTKPISPLFVYHFLKQYHEDLINSYEEILKNPHRKPVIGETWRKFWEIEYIDHEVIINTLRNSREFMKISAQTSSLLNGFKEYIPLEFYQLRKYETYDTAENRFIKYFLEELLIWIDKTIKMLGRKEEKILVELKKTLMKYYNHPIMSEIGRISRPPPVSQILLKRDGYREVYRLWRLFRAYIPFYDRLEKTIENKNVPELYEYWCLFKLIDLLKDITGGIKSLNISIDDYSSNSKKEVFVEFNKGYKLYYNRGVKAYTQRIYIPDYSIYENRRLIGVLDAKFRISTNTQDTQFLDVKDEDLYKIHTYKDSLGVRFAIIVYPGNQNVFYIKPVEKNPGCTEPLREEPRNLLKRVIEEKLEGVGYISLKPSLQLA